MTTLKVHSSIRDYVAEIEESSAFMPVLAALDRACYIVDENVWRYHGESILSCLPAPSKIVLPISEERKQLETVQELYDKLVELPAKRSLTVVSIGGGILQDITGFAASTIYRGVNWIFVPTTLLAQSDSCIGSKTSLNYAGHKNLLGTFYPPTRIHIYTPFLSTLSEQDFYSGLGEVVKLAVMGGHTSLDALLVLLPGVRRRDPNDLRTVIRQSLEIKLSFMEGDEFDKGRRRFLNYGHDFGHALESTSHFAVPHGQAVIVGMLAANMVAVHRSLLAEDTAHRLAETVLLPNLVVKPTAEMLDTAAMVSSMQKDKKRSGADLALILMDDHFDFALVNDLKADEVDSALTVVQQRYLG